ncbi:MAG: dihydroneopterin triphosphate 2'-epimerase [Marinagarivorans sp.]|nr:dihydroneopterin triphosphate 2'-epimerase [Marinagarivorans sp.]
MNIPAIIRIKNLRLRTYIGIKSEEINNRQDVIINAVIHCQVQAAVESNLIDNALNYRTICKAIIALIEDQRFALLERMTFEILDIVMSHPDVLKAEVEVDKVGALRYADSVSIALAGLRKNAGEAWAAGN